MSTRTVHHSRSIRGMVGVLLGATALVMGCLACAQPEASHQGPSEGVVPSLNLRLDALKPGASALVESRAGQVPRSATLRVALISPRPAEAMATYQPLADAVAIAVGLERGEVVASKEDEQLIGKLCRGEIDLLLDSAATAVRIRNGCAGQILLIAAKAHALRYQSVFIVRPESPIRSLEDLRGRRLLLEDPASTSAYVVPLAMLHATGIKVVSTDAAGEEDAVRIATVDEELNIIGGVVHGFADAGVLSSTDLAGFAGAEIRALAKSQPIPRYLVVASPGLPARIVEALRRVGPGLHEQPASRSAFTRSGIGEFELPSDADRAMLDVIDATTSTGPKT